MESPQSLFLLAIGLAVEIALVLWGIINLKKENNT
jgi:hypothetical protein